jgi:hypothetical protein
MSREADPPKIFWVRSMYGAHTKQPIVIITVPGGESVQMRPDEARDLAKNILSCAEAAEQDGFLVEWSQAELDCSPQQAASLLNEYRTWRRRREERGEGDG